MNCLEEYVALVQWLLTARARQSCSAIVDQLEQPIRLEPIVLSCHSRFTS